MNKALGFYVIFLFFISDVHAANNAGKTIVARGSVQAEIDNNTRNLKRRSPIFTEDLVKTGIEDGASALEDEVSAAVDIWIDQHEETLVKSRRFSKKNFTTLKQIIPQIVSKLATKENRGGISKSYIKKTTFRYLDNKFGLSKTINESQNYSRLRKLAGI